MDQGRSQKWRAHVLPARGNVWRQRRQAWPQAAAQAGGRGRRKRQLRPGQHDHVRPEAGLGDLGRRPRRIPLLGVREGASTRRWRPAKRPSARARASPGHGRPSGLASPLAAGPSAGPAIGPPRAACPTGHWRPSGLASPLATGPSAGPATAGRGPCAGARPRRPRSLRGGPSALRASCATGSRSMGGPSPRPEPRLAKPKGKCGPPASPRRPEGPFGFQESAPKAPGTRVLGPSGGRGAKRKRGRAPQAASRLGHPAGSGVCEARPRERSRRAPGGARAQSPRRSAATASATWRPGPEQGPEAAPPSPWAGPPSNLAAGGHPL